MNPRADIEDSQGPVPSGATCEHDFYLLDDGRMVFTERYHLRRGYCCGSGCRHCPFDAEGRPLARSHGTIPSGRPSAGGAA